MTRHILFVFLLFAAVPASEVRANDFVAPEAMTAEEMIDFAWMNGEDLAGTPDEDTFRQAFRALAKAPENGISEHQYTGLAIPKGSDAWKKFLPLLNTTAGSIPCLPDEVKQMAGLRTAPAGLDPPAYSVVLNCKERELHMVSLIAAEEGGYWAYLLFVNSIEIPSEEIERDAGNPLE